MQNVYLENYRAVGHQSLKYFCWWFSPFVSKADGCLVYFFLSSAGFRNIGCTLCLHMNRQMLRHSSLWHATSMHKAFLQAQKDCPQTVIIYLIYIGHKNWAFWKQQALIWLAGLAQFPGAQVFNLLPGTVLFTISQLNATMSTSNEEILCQSLQGLLHWMPIPLLVLSSVDMLHILMWSNITGIMDYEYDVCPV